MMISIHALREEGDSITSTGIAFTVGFLSTPSVRRATLPFRAYAMIWQISIHALREEGDVELEEANPETKTISIHALREEGDDKAQ